MSLIVQHSCSSEKHLIDLAQVVGWNERTVKIREVLLMERTNNLRHVRENKMLSKLELARRAGISPITIDRIEKGMPSRIATRRKILLGLGLDLSESRRVFKEN